MTKYEIYKYPMIKTEATVCIIYLVVMQSCFLIKLGSGRPEVANDNPTPVIRRACLHSFT